MIKLLILDQEGTLYQNKKLLFQIRTNTQEFFCNKLSIQKEDYLEWYNKNKKDFPNIFEALKKLKISVKEYHSQVFDIAHPQAYLKKDLNLLNIFKKLNLPIYVVTSSSKTYSKKVLQSLGIFSLIKDSISLSEENQNKIEIYNQIVQKEKLNPREICVIGDNWDTDLKDAKERGFKTVLIGEKDEKPFFIKSIYNLSIVINQFNYPKISFFDWKKMEELIFKIEKEIRISKFHPDLIIGIARDGLIPAKLFNDRFTNIDLKIILCKRYYTGFSNNIPEIQIEFLGDIHNKRILLIDDTEDKGITLRYVKEKLIELGAAEIKSAVLYSKARESNADFIGVKGNDFAIFPWNKFQELKEFLDTELLSSSKKEKIKILMKMGFSKKDVLYSLSK